jgi:hypothetical protein
MFTIPRRVAALVLAFSPVLLLAAADQEAEIPAFAKKRPEVRSGEPVLRFNGRNLAGFYAYTKGHGYEDPQQVFTVRDGQIRASGEDFGGLATGGNFSDYHLVVEWRWGEQTWGKRAKAARDSGILLHCVGPDGAASGQWMESIECQLIEGGCGDFILVGGRNRPRMTNETRIGPDKQPYFEKGGAADVRDQGRINWWGRDPGWKDVLGTRDRRGIEKPQGEWNRTEVICDGDRIVVLMMTWSSTRVRPPAPPRGRSSSSRKGPRSSFADRGPALDQKVEAHPRFRGGDAPGAVFEIGSTLRTDHGEGSTGPLRRPTWSSSPGPHRRLQALRGGPGLAPARRRAPYRLPLRRGYQGRSGRYPTGTARD